MSGPFAKLFGDDENQVLVLLKQAEDDEDALELVFMCIPVPGLTDVCCIRKQSRHNEHSRKALRGAFDAMTEAQARHAVSSLTDLRG